MNAGNTVFLGLGASGEPTSKPWGWLKSLVSIASFFIGSITFSIVTRRAGARRRGTLISSFMVQFLLLSVSVSLVETDLVPSATNASSSLTDSRLLELIPICLLAFQSAGSITSSRALGFNEIPTVVLTSVYFDIASDPALGQMPLSMNAKRNRRIGGVIMLLAGAIGGGWLSRTNGGMQSALWLGAGLKLCIAALWWFWKSDGESK